MAKAKKTQEKPAQTRAEKRDAAKTLIKELLAKGGLKASALIDQAAKEYAQRFQSEDTENPNDVKGRIGSLLDVMKKDGEVAFDGGVYALKTETAPIVEEEKPVKKTAKKAVKKQEKAEEEQQKEPEKPAKKTTKKKKEEPQEKAVETPLAEQEPAQEKPVKKRAKKAVKPQEEPAQEKVEEKPQEQAPVQAEPAPIEEQKQQEKAEEKQEIAQPKGTLMDVSFLLGNAKETAKETAVKTESKPVQKQQEKQAPTQEKQALPTRKLPQAKVIKTVKKPLTADEKLQAAFLAKLHRLGGDYFEYYSVYLLEKYARQNGRRLESLRITSGDRDGGIDGEMEWTDKLGFRETVYIQSKNWDPDKGDEKLWVVGETLLQQFIGACACRQAKDGKQNCRGIFITTSRFTPDAKRLLDVMSDKIVGYDGTDLYETAKECQFGIVKKNGEWALDEQLLAGEKAFFHMQ